MNIEDLGCLLVLVVCLLLIGMVMGWLVMMFLTLPTLVQVVALFVVVAGLALVFA